MQICNICGKIIPTEKPYDTTETWICNECAKEFSSDKLAPAILRDAMQHCKRFGSCVGCPVYLHTEECDKVINMLTAEEAVNNAGGDEQTAVQEAVPESPGEDRG